MENIVSKEMKPEKLKKYYIKTYDELYNLVNNRMRTASIPPPPKIRGKDKFLQLRNALLVKLGIVYNIIDSELIKIIEALKTISLMHPFYNELFTTKTRKTPRDLIKRFTMLKHTATRIYNDAKQQIKTGLTGKEIVGAFKAGIGRLLSIYRRNNDLIAAIKDSIIELSKLPDITGDLVVIIAGMPQVGKSTLLKKLTHAKPEISPFPFTTKTIIAGHITVEPYGKITLIDTPGLLDRPLNKKNPIEYKAVLALKHLADITIYLFDIDPHSYYTFEQQLNVYRDIRELLGDKDIIIAINKIDITPKDYLEKQSIRIKEVTGKQPLLISAEKEYNLDKLKMILINKLMEKALHHKS
ncbi:small GTP-binding protein [Staphylothermus hellenicus DSM 12710]|uniref:Small GTP-binding protein n=1 Tax=Staphylothermus hellenicus (strain DSM 12710 / JCM 10830 / BK20S6-10-b1 / P8) TaxID=591019 RepID=D7DA23_STAHD|nr:small GTP-binding protein [Staphylothermus hellenicus DSM 12710]